MGRRKDIIQRITIYLYNKFNRVLQNDDYVSVIGCHKLIAIFTGLLHAQEYQSSQVSYSNVHYQKQNSYKYLLFIKFHFLEFLLYIGGGGCPTVI